MQHSGVEARQRQQRSRRRQEDGVEWQGAPLGEEQGEERGTGEETACKVADASAWPRVRALDQDGDGSSGKQGRLEERVLALVKENEFLKRER